MTLYFISGLGADQRAFARLKLPAKYTIVHLNWIDPQKKESIEHYAKRLAAGIDNTEPFVIIGLSFGGMIACEISKFLKAKKIILISSVPTRSNLSGLYRFCGLIQLDRIIPVVFLKKPSKLIYYYFGAKDPETKNLLGQILADTPPFFLKWAIRCILTWKNKTVPPNLIHVHGSADKVLTIRFVNPDKILLDGGHFMVFDRADEVSHWLTEKLQNV